MILPCGAARKIQKSVQIGLESVSMAEGGEGAQYSRLTGSQVDIFLDTRHTVPLAGLIYIFNLIVGTGALTLPAAFKDAGYLCSTVLLFTYFIFSHVPVLQSTGDSHPPCLHVLPHRYLCDRVHGCGQCFACVAPGVSQERNSL